jgi:hypothetical protein
MSEQTRRGTRSRLGPSATEGMRNETDQVEARQGSSEGVTAQTAERSGSDQPVNQGGHNRESEDNLPQDATQVEDTTPPGTDDPV